MFTQALLMNKQSIIKSIQTFEITIPVNATSNTATISSVDTTKSAIFFGGFTTADTGSTYRLFMSRAELTNAITVTGYRDTLSATNTVTVRGTVVEFISDAVTSIQQGTIAIDASATSGTATINAVSTSLSVLFYLGLTVSTSGTSPNSVFSRIDLTNATTVTATRASSSSAVVTVGYCVVEFSAKYVNSIQQRSVAMTGTGASSTDTIASVDIANTLLLYNGVSCTSLTLDAYLYNLQLTAATSVTLARNNSTNVSRTVNYTALELSSFLINTLQRGTTPIDSVISADTTIASVNTSKSVCNWTGFSSNGGSSDARMATAKLATDTIVRGEKNTASTTISTPGWEVVEFI
jgi:hypothetical protein